MQLDLKLCIAIFGPTASGKTKLGVSLAKTFLGEVISVDSLQCYKPGSIITAKPHAKEMQGVPHHMIDYLEADEEPDGFVAMAADKIEDITRRGKLPIFVGGSTSLTIPLLHEAFKRRHRMMAITLVPNQATYQSLIQARGREMLETGLLNELSELKHLQQTLLGDEASFGRGIWKAIGYSEFYSYLQSDAVTGEHGLSIQDALTSMYANTLQYGFHQLEWIRHTLTPLLHKERVACISLPVSDKASWTSDVEGPAISMASEFCHGSRVMWLPSKEISKPRVVCLLSDTPSFSPE
ncbi:hypothetical protein NM208_g10669 [Fusarium decemcellulare]|uniref:Uncharacterized protein n=1 Tax=Fusarium decemcellulare TaxID=57161 RepID=A0ACC1RX22_9HYPO|nr:hypothetical protein NM208_g10669 [Fusarium decemcellulare]